MQHLPYQRAAQLLAEWLGAPISPATLVGFVKDGAADLDEFLDLVHEQITRSPVVHFDETDARVAGRERRLHCASTETVDVLCAERRRGTEGIDHAGVMPRFRGITFHDGWPQYRSYTDATYALCNAHYLRELLGVIEQHTTHQQSWANHMDALLRALHEDVEAAKAAGEGCLDPNHPQAILLTSHAQSPFALGQRRDRAPRQDCSRSERPPPTASAPRSAHDRREAQSRDAPRGK